MSEDWWKPGWREAFTLVTDLSPVECRQRLTGLEKPTNFARVAKAHPVSGRVSPRKFSLGRKGHTSVLTPGVEGTWREVGARTAVDAVVTRSRIEFVVSGFFVLALIGMALVVVIAQQSLFSFAAFCMPLTAIAAQALQLWDSKDDALFLQSFLARTLEAEVVTPVTERADPELTLHPRMLWTLRKAVYLFAVVVLPFILIMLAIARFKQTGALE